MPAGGRLEAHPWIRTVMRRKQASARVAAMQRRRSTRRNYSKQARYGWVLWLISVGIITSCQRSVRTVGDLSPADRPTMNEAARAFQLSAQSSRCMQAFSVRHSVDAAVPITPHVLRSHVHSLIDLPRVGSARSRWHSVANHRSHDHCTRGRHRSGVSCQKI